jgi:hypothetical protein
LTNHRQQLALPAGSQLRIPADKRQGYVKILTMARMSGSQASTNALEKSSNNVNTMAEVYYFGLLLQSKI